MFSFYFNIPSQADRSLVFLLKITKTLHMGQCGGKSYTATCLFASGEFTMRGQKKHINESFSQSLSEN